MDQQILVAHSEPAVVEETLDAIASLPARIVVSTDLAVLDMLCRRYQPDLLVLGYEPDRFGGPEGLRGVLPDGPCQVIFLVPPTLRSIPAVYAQQVGVRLAHPLPIDRDRLRVEVERCLWILQPACTIEALKKDISDRAHSLDTFLDISRVITASLHNDLDSLLHHIAEETSKMLDAERTSLFIYDKINHCLWSRVAEGAEGRTITVGMDEPGIVVHVARTGQPLRVDDTYREPLFNRVVDRITGYRTRTILCLPVRNYHGELIGVIETMNKKVGLFDDTDERILSIASFLFASAIENVQLYQSVRHQIQENTSLERSKIHTERLAMVGQMASSIIHDIRSPLAIIRGYAELAVAGSVSTERRQRFANTISGEVQRLREMARELQEFSEGTQTFQLSSTPLARVIEEVLTFLEGYFKERGITIIQRLEYPGVLMLDGPRIKRVIHNLAVNAADAMPGGGTFRVTVIKVQDQVHVELLDTGVGIPEEIRDRLFEPFVTSGKSHGTGLGLAVVKRIVEEHHGTISVVTGLTGTTFAIRFPLMVPENQPDQLFAEVTTR